MLSKKLTNFKIIQKQDQKGRDYYIIFDNDYQNNGNNAYFCWLNSVKEGWENLKKQDLTEIEIVWEPKEKGNRVTGVLVNDSDSIFV